MHISERIDVRKILLYFLVLLFAYSISGAVFKVLTERTLGSIARGVMPTLPILFLIVLVTLYDTRRLSFASLVPRIPSNVNLYLFLKRLFWIFVLAIPFGIFANEYFSKIALLYTPIILLSLIMLVFSIICVVRNNYLYAMASFIIIIPLLFFLSRDIFFRSGILIYYSNVNQLYVRIGLSSIYLFIMFIFYLISNIQSKVQYKIQKKPLIKLTYFIVVYSLFSVFISKDPYLSFVYYLMSIVAPVILFIFLIKAMNSTENIIFLSRIFNLALILYVFIGFYFLQKAEIISKIGTYQYATANEIIPSVYLGMTAVFGFMLSLLNIRLMNSAIQKTLLIISAIFCVVIILQSNVRGVQIGLMSGLGYLYIVSNVKRRTKIYTTILTLLVAVVLYLVFFEKFTPVLYRIRLVETIKDIVTSGTLTNYTAFKRLEIWKEAVEMIKDHPFFGIGAGMWKGYTFIYGEKLYVLKDIHGIFRWTSSSSPHNQFLTLAVYFGIPVTISFCAIIFLTFKKATLLVKKVNDISKNIIHVVVSMLIVWLTISLFGETIFWEGILLPGFVFWFLIAVIFKMAEFEEDKLTSNA